LKEKGSLYHGYLLIGKKETILERLNNFFEKHLHLSIHGNSDYVKRDIETFGIDDARDISKIHVDKQ